MAIKLDGIDYTPQGISALREDVIVYRNRALDAAPEGMQMAVVLTHVLALLAYLADLMAMESDHIGTAELGETVTE